MDLSEDAKLIKLDSIIILLNIDKEVIWANEPALTFYGCTLQELKQKLVSEFGSAQILDDFILLSRKCAHTKAEGDKKLWEVLSVPGGGDKRAIVKSGVSAHDQAAIRSSVFSSIPLLNGTPSMTFAR